MSTIRRYLEELYPTVFFVNDLRRVGVFMAMVDMNLRLLQLPDDQSPALLQLYNQALPRVSPFVIQAERNIGEVLNSCNLNQ